MNTIAGIFVEGTLKSGSGLDTEWPWIPFYGIWNLYGKQWEQWKDFTLASLVLVEFTHAEAWISEWMWSCYVEIML